MLCNLLLYLADSKDSRSKESKTEAIEGAATAILNSKYIPATLNHVNLFG